MTNPTYDFTGQVALVTGAASGMGLATAQAFAEGGASVVLADLSAGAVEQAARSLVDAGHRAFGIACDVADEAQAAAAVDKAVETYGRLDMGLQLPGVQPQPSDAADGGAEEVAAAAVWLCSPAASFVVARGHAARRRRLHHPLRPGPRGPRPCRTAEAKRRQSKSRGRAGHAVIPNTPTLKYRTKHINDAG